MKIKFDYLIIKEIEAIEYVGPLNKVQLDTKANLQLNLLLFFILNCPQHICYLLKGLTCFFQHRPELDPITENVRLFIELDI